MNSLRSLFLPLLMIAAALMTGAAVTTPKGKNKARAPRKTKTEKVTEELRERWALINLADAPLKTHPSYSSQCETQASYGTPVHILESKDEWSRVELPDGCQGWIPQSFMVGKTSEEIDAWRKSPRVIVTKLRPEVAWNDTIILTGYNSSFYIMPGAIYEGSKKPGSMFVELISPDGRRGYTSADYVADFAEWSRQSPSIDTLLDVARSFMFMGVRCFLGGTTPYDMDCSGLTKLCYSAVGLILPRNASQQALIGQTLDPAQPETFRRGDLLFFGKGDSTIVTHVGIYDGDTRYIHVSDRVSESSFNPMDTLYIPRKVIGACRIIGADSQKGSTPYAEHSMYFNQSK